MNEGRKGKSSVCALSKFGQAPKGAGTFLFLTCSKQLARTVGGWHMLRC